MGFDASEIVSRTFNVKFSVRLEDEKGNESQKQIDIDVYPPRVKDLRRLSEVQRKAQKDSDIDDLPRVLADTLSNNKSHKRITEDIVDALNEEVMQALLSAFLDWVSDTKNN